MDSLVLRRTAHRQGGRKYVEKTKKKIFLKFSSVEAAKVIQAWISMNSSHRWLWTVRRCRGFWLPSVYKIVLDESAVGGIHEVVEEYRTRGMEWLLSIKDTQGPSWKIFIHWHYTLDHFIEK